MVEFFHINHIATFVALLQTKDAISFCFVLFFDSFLIGSTICDLFEREVPISIHNIGWRMKCNLFIQTQVLPSKRERHVSKIGKVSVILSGQKEGLQNHLFQPHKHVHIAFWMIKSPKKYSLLQTWRVPSYVRGKPTASSLTADGFPLMVGSNFQPSDGNPSAISILRQLADRPENVPKM